MPKQNDEDTILLRLATLAKRHTLFIKDNEKVFFINGNKNNIKITNKDDLDMFKKLIEKKLKNRILK